MIQTEGSTLLGGSSGGVIRRGQVRWPRGQHPDSGLAVALVHPFQAQGASGTRGSMPGTPSEPAGDVSGSKRSHGPGTPA